MNEFFATNSQGNFVHDAEVDKFLEALTTQEKFPYSTEDLRDEMKHTLWLLNYVNSAKALAKKLQNHPLFGKDYKIVLAAGDGKLDELGYATNDDIADKNIRNSYDKVIDAIAKNDKTITISVGQLTTGITIPEWTGVMMLSNIKSPALYMQAAFRAQNPCLFEKNGVAYRKENAYVFDFDPARTLTIVEEFANNLNAHTANGRGDSETRKKNVRELLNFFPVYAEDDEGEMIELDAEKVLSIPRAIHAKEVVRRGFMSNFLFQNIGNIFNAPKEVLEIIEKFESVKQPTGIKEDTKQDLYLDDEGEVAIPEDKIIGTASDIFGEKMFGDIREVLADKVDEIQEQAENNPILDDSLEQLLDSYHQEVTDTLIQTAKENYGNDMSRSTQNALERTLNADSDAFVKKQYAEYQIEKNKLEHEQTKQLEVSFGDVETISQINKEFEEKKKAAQEALKVKLAEGTKKVVEDAANTIVKAVETSKKEKARNELMENVRDHLRGFSRTIPSFIMAYGDDKTTIDSFDSIVPDEVFIEVTSICLAEFRRLRDGFDYVDEEGNVRHYNGFFDKVVFDDAIKEFLHKKQQLADYFKEGVNEDIFDYIPPQKTNQIFTPKKVVKLMVKKLEEENPGCFDNPDHTFVDLYMKSGLYIAEIVKRLYQSEKLKALYPDSSERLNHIFAKQVYGLAPTEIIYRIALAFILGFSDEIEIKKHNLKHFDTLPYAQDGTLEQKLDEIFD